MNKRILILKMPTSLLLNILFAFFADLILQKNERQAIPWPACLCRTGCSLRGRMGKPQGTLNRPFLKILFCI